MARAEIFTVTSGDSVLEAFEQAMRDLGDRDGIPAMNRAINRTATMARTRVVRSISRATSVKGSIVRAQTTVHRATVGSLEARIVGRGNTIPLRDMGARQTLKSVSANIYGRRQKFPGLFIMGGSPRSGSPAYQGHVLQNTKLFNRKSGRDNLPHVQFGPSVPGGMRAKIVREEFDRAVVEILPIRLVHEIGRLLPS